MLGKRKSLGMTRLLYSLQAVGKACARVAGLSLITLFSNPLEKQN